MRKHRLPLIAIVAIVLCLSASLGAALAYFSDYEEASGGAVLNLGGETEITEGSDEANKHIVIENTGKTEMIVRVAVYGGQYMTVTLAEPDEWKQIGDFYYYQKVLQPGDATTAIDANLKVEWKGAEPEYDFEVAVVHESAQAVYNGKSLVTPEGWESEGVSGIDPAPAA